MNKPERYYVGQRVRLSADIDNNLTEEIGAVVGPSGPTTYVVQVTPTDAYDDGLREVAWKDMEALP